MFKYNCEEEAKMCYWCEKKIKGKGQKVKAHWGEWLSVHQSCLTEMKGLKEIEDEAEKENMRMMQEEYDENAN